MEWVTTSTLLVRLGDFANRDAWEQFAQRFREPIIHFARSSGLAEADAEDVAQESLLAFAQAHQRGEYDRSKGRLSQWLFGIAYRKAMDALRARARREAKIGLNVAESSFWVDVPDEESASTAWDTTWHKCLLQHCLEQVQREVEPTTYRAFELVAREHRSAADVAQELGVPIKLVYNAKHRVLKRIRELREEFDHVEPDHRPAVS